MTTRIEESPARFWLLTAAPATWAAHFMLCYVTASLWCGKVAGAAGTLGGARTLILGYTVVALTGIGAFGWIGYRAHRFESADLPHDFDSDEGRHRFLGLATLLLSCLSAVAVLYAALAVVFIEGCA